MTVQIELTSTFMERNTIFICEYNNNNKQHKDYYFDLQEQMKFALNIKNLIEFSYNETISLSMSHLTCDPRIQSKWFSNVCSTIKNHICPKTQPWLRVPCLHKTNPLQVDQNLCFYGFHSWVSHHLQYKYQ